MSKKIIATIAVVSVVLLTFIWFKKSTPEKTDVYTKLQKINNFDLNTVKGEYFVLHFWAKWCEPCAEEIPHLVEFARKAQFQKPLKILAVSLDPNLEESKQILPDHGNSLPANFILVLDADHQFAESMGSFQYPETYFIDPNGQIVEKWVGPQKWNKPEVLEFFKQKVL
jgi:thiol-disulfide isomerase/thioredoxin